jgi:hypothetical protein
VHYEDKLAWVWPAVQPFSGLNDARLWTTTSYCLSSALRMDSLGESEFEAQEAESACRQHVEQVHSAK